MRVPTVEEVRDLLSSHLPAGPTGPVAVLGEGLDNAAFAVDGLVVRFAKEPDAAERAAAVVREARVLAVAARVSPVPVPVPVLALPDRGCLAYRRLPGVPLIEVRDRADPIAVAEVLADLLRALHAVPLADVDDVLAADDEPLAAWRADAVEQYADAREHVPDRYRPAIEEFLAAAPPPAADTTVFSHNDLGIEHVLVDPATGTVSGVIDWTDAGLVDPAADCGRVLRDLGPAALYVVLAGRGGGLRDRAGFYARCGVLEDLAHGLRTGQPSYVDKSIDALAWLFP